MIKKFEEGKQHVFLNQGKMYAAYLNGQYYLGKDVDKTEDIGESANITESGTYLLTPGRYGFEVSGGAGGSGAAYTEYPNTPIQRGKKGEKKEEPIWISSDTLCTITIGEQGDPGEKASYDKSSWDQIAHRAGRNGQPTLVSCNGQTITALGGDGGKMNYPNKTTEIEDIWKEDSTGASNNNGSARRGYVNIYRIG